MIPPRRRIGVAIVRASGGSVVDDPSVAFFMKKAARVQPSLGI
ncbi:hypothetical protein ACEQ6A_21660 [Rhizobium brockwellii]|jgi:hypothetical protein